MQMNPTSNHYYKSSSFNFDKIYNGDFLNDWHENLWQQVLPYHLLLNKSQLFCRIATKILKYKIDWPNVYQFVYVVFS